MKSTIDHIQIWKDRKAAADKQHDCERAMRKQEDQKTTEKTKQWLTNHNCDFKYISAFDYNGLSCSYIDQHHRIIGNIHRPFLSDEDRECFHDMERDMDQGKAPLFIREYCYHHFIIDGKLPRVLGRVLKLMDNVLIIT